MSDTLPPALEKAFERAVHAHADAALRMIDALVFIQRTGTAALAIKHRLPVTATSVDKILRGAKPARLPVEQPTKSAGLTGRRARRGRAAAPRGRRGP